MLIIEVKDGKIEKALKELKRKVSRVGQIQEIRNKQEFTKPSVVRRKEIKKAQYIQKLKNSQED